MTFEQQQEMVMKLLHFFITKYNYNLIMLHGAKDEIWLENLEHDYKIIRIVSRYIHNNEQFNYDMMRVKQISKVVKKKTVTMNVPVLSFFVSLGDDIELPENGLSKYFVLNSINEIVLNDDLNNIYKDFKDLLLFENDDQALIKLSNEINEKTKNDAIKNEHLFSPKLPIITYAIIGINCLIFLLMYILGEGSNHIETLINFGANNKTYVLFFNEYYRIVTSAFLHIDILHLVLNMYAIYFIGKQVESFFGKWKFLIIYIGSAIMGGILSLLFASASTVSAGASGAVFGLLGALLYFGYKYRVYLGNMLKSQLVPIIVINLLFGFMVTGIDNAAHIGGLIGGFLLSMAVGVTYKSSLKDKINGIALFTIFTIFIIILLNNVQF